MKKIPIYVMLLFCSLPAIAQVENAKVLTLAKQTEIFNDEVRNFNNLSYPIYRSFEYKDKTGTYYLTLTESVDGIKDKDTVSKNIKAAIFKKESGLKKITEINDAIVANEHEEYTIHFWTKYTSFESANEQIVPILVYGSKAMNGYMDGRVKIIIWYKDQKIVIRHQNGTLDGERLTTIDKDFYTLPKNIQKAVKDKMKTIEQAKQAIFGNDWALKMKKQKREIKG